MLLDVYFGNFGDHDQKYKNGIFCSDKNSKIFVQSNQIKAATSNHVKMYNLDFVFSFEEALTFSMGNI